MKKTLSITDFVNNNGCFDLQFRKDTRHERSGSPTYYRWRAQFVVTGPKENKKILENIRRELRCGEITSSGFQTRFSVQKINDAYDTLIPYFRKNCLSDKKKKDFELWSKAIEIIQENKGKALINWKKSDLCSLIEIHKSSAKYKNRPRPAKWLDIAKSLTKTA